MTDPYIGEIQLFGFSFAPYQWSFANGALVPIQQNTALFALLGTTFGGNGQSNFQLPNLASRFACGIGQSPGKTYRDLGETFGEEYVYLTQPMMPAHSHAFNAYLPGDIADLTQTPGATTGAGGGFTGSAFMYSSDPASVAMSLSALTIAGASQPHPNVQPYLGINYSIALYGNYPAFP
ncbi:phage tail protein [Sphingomonas sp. CJ20]